MMTLLFFKQRKTRNLIILLTPEGVSVSLMGFPSNLNRTTPSFNPWGKKKRNTVKVFKFCVENKFTLINFHYILTVQNCLSKEYIITALSQYADISFLRGVFFLILKCTTLPSCPVTFKLMCSLLSGLISS